MAQKKSMSSGNRLLLLATGLLAAYQIAVGIEGDLTVSTVAYTVSFGVLLVAGLLLLLLGFEILASPVVVVVTTIIPLGLAIGLVWETLPAARLPAGGFAAIGLLLVVLSRAPSTPPRLSAGAVALVHGVAGLTITFLPLWLVVQGRAPLLFGLVGVGGALIGVGGLLLSFLKAGRPLLPQRTIRALLPGLLLAMTACVVAGFNA